MSRESESFSGLFAKYYNRLKSFIRKKVKTEDDAEDLAQEVFYKLATVDRAMQPLENVSAWLYAVAKNQITDWWRKRQNNSSFEYLDEELNFIELGDILADKATPEEKYIQSLLWKELDEALATLPKEQREVFELTELEGISFKEVSEMTGVGINTLLSRKRYAVQYLRNRLDDIYDIIMYD